MVPVPINAIQRSWQQNTQKDEKISAGMYIYIYKFWIHLLSAHRFPFSSIDDSEAESSNVEFEMVSLSEVPDGLSWSTGCFKYQYIMLAVNVRIIFWFTWKRKGANLIYVLFWNKIRVPRANEVSSCNSSAYMKEITSVRSSGSKNMEHPSFLAILMM